jgi:YegS/Rv2252/BmrU family lipid kinase
MKFIINPVSGGGRACNLWPEIKEYLTSQGIEFSFNFTGSSGQAIEMTQAALRLGEDIVVAVGGDGTVNEVLNGFFDDGKEINPSARLGVIPAGTGSDWCRTAGIPPNSRAAVQVLLSRRTSSFDVGKITCSFTKDDGGTVSRYFLNAADAGFGAAVVDAIAGTSRLLGNRGAYFWGLLSSLFRNINVDFEVRLDGREIANGKHIVVVAANGRFFGGGMHIAPQADARDGLIDVVLIGDMQKFEVVRNLGKLYGGRIAEVRKVTMARGQRLEIASESRVGVEVDGELVGTLPACFEILPKGINLIH